MHAIFWLESTNGATGDFGKIANTLKDLYGEIIMSVSYSKQASNNIRLN